MAYSIHTGYQLSKAAACYSKSHSASETAAFIYQHQSNITTFTTLYDCVKVCPQEMDLLLEEKQRLVISLDEIASIIRLQPTVSPWMIARFKGLMRAGQQDLLTKLDDSPDQMKQLIALIPSAEICFEDLLRLIKAYPDRTALLLEQYDDLIENSSQLMRLLRVCPENINEIILERKLGLLRSFGYVIEAMRCCPIAIPWLVSRIIGMLHIYSCLVTTIAVSPTNAEYLLAEKGTLIHNGSQLAEVSAVCPLAIRERLIRQKFAVIQNFGELAEVITTCPQLALWLIQEVVPRINRGSLAQLIQACPSDLLKNNPNLLPELLDEKSDAIRSIDEFLDTLAVCPIIPTSFLEKKHYWIQSHYHLLKFLPYCPVARPIWLEKKIKALVEDLEKLAEIIRQFPVYAVWLLQEKKELIKSWKDLTRISQVCPTEARPFLTQFELPISNFNDLLHSIQHSPLKGSRTIKENAWRIQTILELTAVIKAYPAKRRWLIKHKASLIKNGQDLAEVLKLCGSQSETKKRLLAQNAMFIQDSDELVEVCKASPVEASDICDSKTALIQSLTQLADLSKIYPEKWPMLSPLASQLIRTSEDLIFALESFSEKIAEKLLLRHEHLITNFAQFYRIYSNIRSRPYPLWASQLFEAKKCFIKTPQEFSRIALVFLYEDQTERVQNSIKQILQENPELLPKEKLLSFCQNRPDLATWILSARADWINDDEQCSTILEKNPTAFTSVVKKRSDLTIFSILTSENILLFWRANPQIRQSLMDYLYLVDNVADQSSVLTDLFLEDPNYIYLISETILLHFLLLSEEEYRQTGVESKRADLIKMVTPYLNYWRNSANILHHYFYARLLFNLLEYHLKLPALQHITWIYQITSFAVQDRSEHVLNLLREIQAVLQIKYLILQNNPQASAQERSMVLSTLAAFYKPLRPFFAEDPSFLIPANSKTMQPDPLRVTIFAELDNGFLRRVKSAPTFVTQTGLTVETKNSAINMNALISDPSPDLIKTDIDFRRAFHQRKISTQVEADRFFTEIKSQADSIFGNPAEILKLVPFILNHRVALTPFFDHIAARTEKILRIDLEQKYKAMGGSFFKRISLFGLDRSKKPLVQIVLDINERAQQNFNGAAHNTLYRPVRRLNQ